MTQVYFHCSNADEVLIDRRGAAVAISPRHAIMRPA